MQASFIDSIYKVTVLQYVFLLCVFSLFLPAFVTISEAMSSEHDFLWLGGEPGW